IGMIAAAKIAGARGMIGTVDLTRIVSLCLPLIPPLRSFPSVAELLHALGTDKKRRAGQNLWVLPLRIGRVVICDDVSRGEVNAAMRDLAKLLGRRAQGS
ncbi:MAG TPA: hypothetical protein VLB27_04960, partial [candidate division Zixibacteria bacterium]|nr:hypothetical protein [candidate division Zixibacteria bacterium]